MHKTKYSLLALFIALILIPFTALAEDRSIIDIPIVDLPHEIKEGDHIYLEDGIYNILPTDDNRKKCIQNLLNELWK